MNAAQTSPRSYQPIMQKTQKILALQQQLLNLRKEMSKKQSQWQKQRSNLLSKNEVGNIQIIQLKQRISNLMKINQTLANAMSSGETQNVDKVDKGKKRNMVVLEDVSDFSAQSNQNLGNQSGRKMEKYQDEIKRLNKILGEKDSQLNNLSKMIGDFKNKMEERNHAVGILEENCYNLKKKLEKKQEQILRLHKQIQQLQDKLEQHAHQIDETRRKSSQPQPRPNLIPQLDQSSEYIKKYTKNSSYLIMKPTPDHSALEVDISSNWNDNNFSELAYDDQSEDDQKLLCQVCNRVFSFGVFEDHVKVCGYRAKDGGTRHLLQKKKEIETKLERIRLQQQKQNNRNRYKIDSRYDYPDNQQNLQKIKQIRQIAKDLTSNRREMKKNPYSDFSIKSNYYY